MKAAILVATMRRVIGQLQQPIILLMHRRGWKKRDVKLYREGFCQRADLS